MAGPKYIVATDVGGTCTDTVVIAAGEPFHIGKALSTPPNFADGVIDSIAVAADAMGTTVETLFSQSYLFVHGSTVVDNTVLTQDGARTGLITTAGFEDTLLVTRGAYGRWGGLPEERVKHPVATDRADPLVPMERIRGVRERVDYKGAIIQPLDEAEAERAVRSLIEDEGVEAIAVSFLWSFYNPAHEIKIKDIVKRISPETYVTLSSEIAPVPGEFERTSTAVINAYAGRMSKAYINNLERQLAERGYAGQIMVMQGYGGLLPAAEAADRAVGMIECGPAAGVIGAKFLGGLMGQDNIIAADMGGTTFKVGVIQDGEIEYAREPMVARFHYVAPKIEVVSIGAGGGSIISLEPGTKAPKVGPRSAGADPGPICYGRGGTEVTLTDVMTLIGYMDPDIFLGGRMRLDIDAARRAFETQISGPLGMSVEEAAFGIYRVAAAQIADLIHEITVERGLDPRDFELHAFGGSCPLVCGVFGRELSVKRIVIPYTAAVNCAFGLVSADIVHEYSLTQTLPAPSPADAINAIYAPLLQQAKDQLAREEFADDQMAFNYAVDLRYGLQVHEVTTTVNGATPFTEATVQQLMDDFEALYERKYGKGSAYRGAGMEMTQFRLSGRGKLDRPDVPRETLEGPDASAAITGKRDIFVEPLNAFAPADIYDFTKLRPGNQLPGPAVIHTPITTIVVQSGQTATMDELRNIVLDFH
ncbi:MAG TPA: hydantoinase/oxoprolinase family protein [Alphaproteobacteria bacterium]|nr:hydantoinase/oxoprolinase family protein [Alphaproteobacteria bacterium]